MKILLISPVRDTGERTNKGLMMPQLALYILEGLTPAGHRVMIVEEETMTLDLDEDCDLVGISCMTSNAVRAYEIADHFRARGIKVVLGGVHPTILTEEALEHADSVVSGEAEGVWEQVVKDAENGSLREIYHKSEPDMNTYIQKNFASLRTSRLFDIIPIMTTRGCPYNCDFCCVSNLFGKKIRHVPIENVVRDIEESKSKNFIFLDDNIIARPKYAKELFKAIQPLNINWVGQSSISFAKDTELMRLAADSGCRALFIGLESVCETQMSQMKKAEKKLDELEEALKNIRRMGILIHASMIFGFDQDTEKTFEDTLEFLLKNRISTVSFNVLTPYPGTGTYDAMKSEGRLLTDNWKYYDHNTVVFKPRNMSPLELQVGKVATRKKFYTLLNVMRRFGGNLSNPLVYLFTNIGHMKQVRVEEKRIPRLRKELWGYDN